MYNKNKYEKIKSFFLKKNARFLMLKAIYKGLPVIVFAAYSVMLLYLFLNRNEKLQRCITVPLGVFLSVSLIRKFIDCERPYEKLDIQPLIKKNKKGQSSPSRHTASAAVIGMVFFYINIPLGIIFLIIAALIGMSRICAGVHFPIDVVSGFLYAVLVSVIFFYVL